MGAAVVGFSSCNLGRPRWKSSIGFRSPSDVLGLCDTSELDRFGFALGGGNGGGVGVRFRLPEAVAELPKTSVVTSLRGLLPCRINGAELIVLLAASGACSVACCFGSALARGDDGGVG